MAEKTPRPDLSAVKALGVAVTNEDGSARPTSAIFADLAAKAEALQSAAAATKPGLRNSFEDFKATVNHEIELFGKHSPEVMEKMNVDLAKLGDPEFKANMVKEIKDLWDTAAAGGDGSLNWEQWKVFWESMFVWEEKKYGGGPRTTEEKIKERFEAYCIKGNECVSYEEWLQREAEKEVLGAEIMQAAAEAVAK